ncbi:MAG TPA: TIGR00725 family protein [Casimicrobiaceae bacterium]|nr:TIGR00725 family protein [Casimicrobiaceae bacterium]
MLVMQLIAMLGADAAVIGKALFTPIGLAFASSYCLIPRVVMSLLPVLVNLEQGQLEVAESLGATPREAFLHVVLPAIAAPAIGTACLIAAVVFGAYGTALALVGTSVDLLPLQQYSMVSDTGSDFGCRGVGIAYHRDLFADPRGRRRARLPPRASSRRLTMRGQLRTDDGMLRVPIGVIGPRQASSEQLAIAYAVGEGLAARGYPVLCGGREGVMEAVCRGVASRGGIAIGLLPDGDWASANAYVTLAVATGLGEARNAVIARGAFCLIAVGDSLGTLSEVALGLHFGKRVFGLCGAAAIAGVEHRHDVESVLDEVDRLVQAIA